MNLLEATSKRALKLHDCSVKYQHETWPKRNSFTAFAETFTYMHILDQLFFRVGEFFTRIFQGRGGFVKSGSFDKHLSKIQENKAPQGKILEFFLLENYTLNGKFNQRMDTIRVCFFLNQGTYFDFQKGIFFFFIFFYFTLLRLCFMVLLLENWKFLNFEKCSIIIWPS